MAKMITVVPAYGRDYKSKKAVLADYNADKDFLVQDMFSGNDGSYINKADAEQADLKLKIRYDRLTKLVVV